MLCGYYLGLTSKEKFVKAPGAKIGLEDKPITENVQRIISGHPNLFEGVGRMKDATGKPVEVDVKVKPNATPHIQKFRPIPIAVRHKLENWLTEGLKDDLIEGPLDSSDSHDYVSNLVITSKKWSDAEMRFNLDMRNANRDIVRVHYPMPTVQELRHELAGFAKVTQLDLKHGYH